MGIETLALASLGSSLIGGGISAIGASNTASANAQSAQYQAAVARNNAIIAERNAEQARQKGYVDAWSSDIKAGQNIGQQKVVQASNGLDVNSGSNAAVRQSTMDLAHLDSLTVLQNAAKQVAGFKAQASGFTADAGLNDMKASNARTAGDYAVAGSLMGAASSFSDKWLGYSSKGIDVMGAFA